MIIIGIDMGSSSLKLCSARGQSMTYARVSLPIPGHQAIGRALSDNLDYLELVGDLAYCVGRDAHAVGSPLENLDNNRFDGNPVTRALFNAALYEHLSTYYADEGRNDARGSVKGRAEVEVRWRVGLAIGLPLAMWLQYASQRREPLAWAKGSHQFVVRRPGSKPTSAQCIVEQVLTIPQAAGTLYDWAFQPDESGGYVVRPEFNAVVGVVNIGMNTTEIMVSEHGRQEPALASSLSVGVKNYMMMYEESRGYSFAQLDERIRRGEFPHRAALRLIWENNLQGQIYRIWQDNRARIERYILSGGGIYLISEQFKDFLRFGREGVQFEVRDVLSTASGLHKIALRTLAQGTK